MKLEHRISNELNRRSFLGQAGIGLGLTALGSLMNPGGGLAKPTGQQWTGVMNPPPLPVKAKRVIFLCMAGGPSHLETFDNKPELAKLHGKPMPESFTKGQQIAQLQGKDLKAFGPQHEFKRWGQSGQEFTHIFPHLGKIADEIAIIRSMQTEQINHDPAHTFMNTGSIIAGRPSMGSWINYGLGSENNDLPGFVVLTSVGGGQSQPIAARQWHSGFLPSRFQGVRFRSQGDPVLYVNNPAGVNREQQGDIVNTVQGLNQLANEQFRDPEIETRIAQYEMAFRMQASVPELMNISDEPQHILDMYGTKGGDGSYAGNCLLARRLAERGVRFIQLYHRGWDHHGGIKKGIEHTAGLVDKATAALVTDLRQRGMLDDTLIVYGGEFGRTPMAQGNGRDHHIKAFSMWLAGAGIKGGVTHGATDDLGYNAVKDVVHVHDLHATMLHLLGIPHKQLTYRFQGRDFRLTDVHGNLVKPILT
ncbi:MAG TPA: sulfatase [Verrucomicrobiales bacterium]|nr:sulfatase [Verrucomicrobiales bacterium]|tara:strand:- start:512 stop:1939 length:1428 start_codon:yes stop_codon:yes gene_type:complete